VWRIGAVMLLEGEALSENLDDENLLRGDFFYFFCSLDFSKFWIIWSVGANSTYSVG
jgi:hypothetical protein